MTIYDKTEKSRKSSVTTAVAMSTLLFIMILGPGLLAIDVCLAGSGYIGDGGHYKGKWPRACSWTSEAAFKACLNEAEDDFWIANGNCTNLPEAEDRTDCFADAKAERQEAREMCGEQRQARLELCLEIGEARYAPRIDPDQFVDFEAVIEEGMAFSANPYFPLVPGTSWIYKTKNAEGKVVERIKVEVLEETKEILGVNCIVVRDRVWEIEENEEGERERALIEDTHDWYAQELSGTIWYFGEIARNYEDGELIDLEGSWKAGRDFAKPGILMWDYPQGADSEPGAYAYRQEFDLGNAEDVAEFIGFVESMEVRGVTYKNILKTKEYSPIEPNVFEYKYYTPDFGLILEEGYEDDVPTGERVELVKMSAP